MIVTLKNTYDVGYKNMGDAHQIATRTFNVDAGVTQINPGDVVVVSSQNPTFAIGASNGCGVIGTDVILGIAAGYSTQTSDLAGTVEVFTYSLNTVMRAKPTQAFTNQADADSVIGNRALFAFSGTQYTVDNTVGTDPTYGVVIVAADFATQLVDFKLDPVLAQYL